MLSRKRSSSIWLATFNCIKWRYWTECERDFSRERMRQTFPFKGDEEGILIIHVVVYVVPTLTKSDNSVSDASLIKDGISYLYFLKQPNPLLEFLSLSLSNNRRNRVSQSSNNEGPKRGSPSSFAPMLVKMYWSMEHLCIIIYVRQTQYKTNEETEKIAWEFFACESMQGQWEGWNEFKRKCMKVLSESTLFSIKSW
jgi:hypothetical protein